MIHRNPLLLLGGVLSLAAALLHLACIVGGPSWYRFLGAGEGTARAAQRGEWRPTMITLGVAAVLFIWAGYAFSGAGLISRLPILRTGLVVITGIYLLRGLVLFRPSMLGRPDLSAAFLFWSSLTVLAIGLIYGVGTWRGWNTL